MKAFLIGFALTLAVLHPWLALAVVLSFLGFMAVAIAARLGVTIPIPWRST